MHYRLLVIGAVLENDEIQRSHNYIELSHETLVDTKAVEYGGINVEYMKERDCKHFITCKIFAFSYNS